MPTQQAIRNWFDHTYSTKGLSYLRPPEFYSIFMEYLGVGPGDRVLDIGCGPGLLLGRALERGASAWGIDVSEAALAMVAREAPRANVGVCNAEALCWPDGFFDFLTCIGVFEHALHPEQVLHEMRRVLKPTGRICLMVPNSRTLKWQIEANLMGVHDEDSNERAFTFETWRDILVGSGFAIEQIHSDEWPAYARRVRFLGKRAGRFQAFAHRSRRLLPMRYSNQYVFILRP